jgi:hypothetical protein
MRDRSQSNRPAPSEPPAFADDAGWRETFLYELRPGDSDTLRRLAELLAELARESALLSPGAGNLGSALRAAVADLRHLQAFLGFLASYRTAAELAPPDFRLAGRAERWAARLDTLAAQIDSALAEVRP